MISPNSFAFISISAKYTFSLIVKPPFWGFDSNVYREHVFLSRNFKMNTYNDVNFLFFLTFYLFFLR